MGREGVAPGGGGGEGGREEGEAREEGKGGAGGEGGFLFLFLEDKRPLGGSVRVAGEEGGGSNEGALIFWKEKEAEGGEELRQRLIVARRFRPFERLD